MLRFLINLPANWQLLLERVLILDPACLTFTFFSVKELKESFIHVRSSHKSTPGETTHSSCHLLSDASHSLRQQS